MSNLTKQRDEWHNFGGTYHRSGTTRGTTTSTGVFAVATGFSRILVDAFASDQATGTRVTQTGGGPAQTQGTFFTFQLLTPSDTTARFRVRRRVVSAGGTLSSYTLASTVTGVTLRWHGFGY